MQFGCTACCVSQHLLVHRVKWCSVYDVLKSQNGRGSRAHAFNSMTEGKINRNHIVSATQIYIYPQQVLSYGRRMFRHWGYIIY